MVNRKEYLLISGFKVYITGGRHTWSIDTRFSDFHKGRCFYIVKEILFMKLVLHFPPRYFFVLWFILASKIKPKEEE